MTPIETNLTDLLELQVQGTRDTGAHAHSQGQLVWVRSGAMVVQAEAGRWAQTPGKVGWIPPRCTHSARSFGPLAAQSVYVEATMCSELPQRPAVFGTSPLADRLMERLGSRAAQEDSARRHRLVAVLLDELADAPQPAHHLPLPAEPRLQRMAAAMMAEPDDARTLDDWALELGMSRRTLMRRFEQETGQTVGRWRQQARLFEALDLLARGESVTAVALSVGYASVSAFIERFRDTFGVTPSRLTTTVP